MWLTQWKCFPFICLIFFLIIESASGKLPDGKLAAKLDEYHVTVKCMANIVEYWVPELNAYMICCGFWTFSDFLHYLMESSCEEVSLNHVQQLNGLILPFINDQCDDQGYKHGASICRWLILVPIFATILLILLITSVCICSCVSFQKLIRLRREYRRVINLNSANLQSSNDLVDNELPESSKRKLSKTSDQI